MLRTRSRSFVIPVPDSFPQELVDRIIDEVWHAYRDETSGKDTLKACSSVCRSWRPRAMHHFARSFSLNLLRTRSRTITIEKTQALSQFIKFKAPPTFPASFVTTMYICSIYKAKLVQEVMCCLHLYPNLRELELEDVFFSRLKTKTLSKALDKFPLPPLHRLGLSEIYFTDSEHFLSFIGISHFSAICVLDICDISYGGQKEFYGERALVKHNSQSDGPLFATSLTLREGYQSAGSPIKDIIYLLGNFITELELVVRFETGKLTYLDFDPCLCPSLRRLSFTYYYITPYVSFPLPQLNALTSLNVLTHFSFRISYFSSMTMQSHWRNNPDARNEMIERLDQALTPISRMPSIQEIGISKYLDVFESLVESRRTGHLVEEG
ncbi:hypothetical protein K435DRAFT_968990 [Dendrothele bispora CBS 962.96]|uniref:Uncharacterized protein n=1 Tax=Dendrothele bispora (strain CBS 962.96) TaxID=1314807 RepID=A0A4S8LK79_DENBC|nr:hypothetical protein K435DRAFT_968990 [Dendrothele bispora CBS 962.96]